MLRRALNFHIWYVLQIINNYSPKCRWLVVDIYQVAKRRGKHPSPATVSELKSSCNTSFIPVTITIFSGCKSSANCWEVNSKGVWIANQSAPLTLSTVSVDTNERYQRGRGWIELDNIILTGRRQRWSSFWSQFCRELFLWQLRYSHDQ